jgi:hypothetical protein
MSSFHIILSPLSHSLRDMDVCWCVVWTHKLLKKYDFYKYIQRTMEVDFRVVVGIRFVI